jgi:hypothetical protein
VKQVTPQLGVWPIDPKYQEIMVNKGCTGEVYLDGTIAANAETLPHEIHSLEVRRLGQGNKQEGKAVGLVLTSFRRGGPNDTHDLLKAIDQTLCSDSRFNSQYVHYQSGHENTLFNFKQGHCPTEEETRAYFGFNMGVNWYIEWLGLLEFIAENGGDLLVFDLGGGATLSTSPNCAMELGLLYQIFGDDIEDTREIRDKIKLMVLTDSDLDLKAGDITISDLLHRKREDQAGQRRLFRMAYEKCSDLLEAGEALPILGRWINDFRSVAENSVAYLERAFFRLMTAEMLGVWCEDEMNKEVVDRLKISHSNRLESIPSSIGRLSHLVNLAVSSNNNLVGPIPDLSGLVSLQKLNLTKNALNGTNCFGFTAIYKLFISPIAFPIRSDPLGDVAHSCAGSQAPQYPSKPQQL